MSLAVAAACGSGTMCRPTLVPWSPAGEQGAVQCSAACRVGLAFGRAPLCCRPGLPGCFGTTSPPRVPPLRADGGAPLFRARGLRHPAGLSGRDGTFVPNDIELGGADAPPFVVLTGALAGRPVQDGAG